MSRPSTKELILDSFPALSPKLQQAARFVVDHPHEVARLSMRGVAEVVGCAPPTFVRLAQRLGFTGWPELKSSVFRDLGLVAGGRYGRRAREIVRRATHSDLIGEIFDTHQANLASSRESAVAGLYAAARILRKARVVHIAAFRASFAVGYSLAYGYRLFRDSLVLIDGFAGGLELQALSIHRNDAVVVFGFVPYSREALQVVDAASATGAKVVAITDSSASPLALKADAAILFETTSPSYFPSLAAAMAVTEALLELLMAEAGEDALKRLEMTESKLVSSGAYVEA